MTFDELQTEIEKYIYSEDDGMIRIALAAIVATQLRLGDPVWLILIGPSSSGKSQVLRPLALTNKAMHRVDDLTENTFLSGIRVGKGQKDISLLKRIGPIGIIVISDFTVIFSKSPETRAAILSQLRMVYDGEMVKYSGNNSEPISWKGYLGVLAGSTPSIYAHFEETADMGERFIYYRMKPYDVEKATRRSLSRTLFGKELDAVLSELYREYIHGAVHSIGVSFDTPIPLDAYERIVNISMFAALLRTPIHYDRFQKAIDRVPVSELPMRVAGQLFAIAKGLMVLSHYDTGQWVLEESDIEHIEWCAYSLANEERRACLRVLASVEYGNPIRTQTIADTIGLSTTITGVILQHLAAVSIIIRTGDSSGLMWKIKEISTWQIVRRLEGIKGVSQDVLERETSEEEKEEISMGVDVLFDDFK